MFEITLIKLTSLSDSSPKKIVETPKVEKPIIKEVIKPVEEVKVEPIIENKVEEEISENNTAARVLSDNITPIERVIYLKDAEQEESFAIADDLMVQVMAISKKEIKSELVDGWKNIKKLSTHEKYGKAATLLIDGRPLVASPKVLILEYPLSKLAEKVNLKENQAELQTVINHIFNKHMFVYAVSRNQSIDLQALYMNLLQIGKLPKAKDVNLEFIGE